MSIKNSGFSLIELLVVIAIVALLSAVAIPAYKDYTVRAKVGSSLPVFESIRSASLKYHQSHSTWPTAIQLGYTTSGGDTVLATPETELSNLIEPLANGGSYIEETVISSPCDASYQTIRLFIKAGSNGPFSNGSIFGIYRVGENQDGMIINQCSEDISSSGETNNWFNSCMYDSRVDFEAALCS